MEINKREIQSFKVICASFGRLYSGFLIEDTNQTTYFQIGCIGLLKSVDKFDLSFDVKFSTYAVPMIIGEIQRFLRDDGSVKVSRSLKETGNKIRKMRDELSKEFGRAQRLMKWQRH